MSQEKVSKTSKVSIQAGQHNLHYVPGKHGLNRASLHRPRRNPLKSTRNKNLPCFWNIFIGRYLYLSFIHHFMPRLSAFVDSYYSLCGPHSITPGRFYYRNAKLRAKFGYGKYLMAPFWYTSAVYQARLFSPWVFWLDQTRLISILLIYFHFYLTKMNTKYLKKYSERRSGKGKI